MNKLTKIGLIGAVITAICCFSPLLVWVFAAIGLAGLIGYLDLVLLPLLAVFIALTIWGFIGGQKASRGSSD